MGPEKLKIAEIVKDKKAPLVGIVAIDQISAAPAQVLAGLGGGKDFGHGFAGEIFKTLVFQFFFVQ